MSDEKRRLHERYRAQRAAEEWPDEDTDPGENSIQVFERDLARLEALLKLRVLEREEIEEGLELVRSLRRRFPRLVCPDEQGAGDGGAG